MLRSQRQQSHRLTSRKRGRHSRRCAEFLPPTLRERNAFTCLKHKDYKGIKYNINQNEKASWNWVKLTAKLLVVNHEVDHDKRSIFSCALIIPTGRLTISTNTLLTALFVHTCTCVLEWKATQSIPSASSFFIHLLALYMPSLLRRRNREDLQGSIWNLSHSHHWSIFLTIQSPFVSSISELTSSLIHSVPQMRTIIYLYICYILKK